MSTPALKICAVRQFPFDTHLRREVDVLLDAGHAVDVVCMWRPGEPRHERRGRLTIWRMPIRHRRGGPARYVWEHAAFVAAAGLTVAALHFRRRFDVVQVNTPPDSVVLVAMAAKATGTPLLVDLVECTPEFFATRFGTSMQHPVVRLLTAIEQRAIRHSDAAITGTRQMRRRFAERGASSDGIDVVLNASDERFFVAGARAALHDEGSAFTLVCHGTIEPRYGLDTVLRAMALLSSELPDVRLEIYGEGSQTEELQRLAHALRLSDRVRFNGFVPIEVLVAGISRADAGVVAVKRDPFRDLTHTNKMFDYVALGRPAIVSWTEAVADYFDDTAFEFFRSDDPHDLARAIRRVHGDGERRAEMVARATALYEPYRWARQREIYLRVVERLANGRGEPRNRRMPVTQDLGSGGRAHPGLDEQLRP